MFEDLNDLNGLKDFKDLKVYGKRRLFRRAASLLTIQNQHMFRIRDFGSLSVIIGTKVTKLVSNL